MSNKALVWIGVLAAAGAATWYFLLRKPRVSTPQNTSPLTPSPAPVGANTVGTTRPPGSGGVNSQSQANGWNLLNGNLHGTGAGGLNGSGTLAVGTIDATPFVAAAGRGLVSLWNSAFNSKPSSPSTTTTPAPTVPNLAPTGGSPYVYDTAGPTDPGRYIPPSNVYNDENGISGDGWLYSRLAPGRRARLDASVKVKSGNNDDASNKVRRAIHGF